MAPACVARSTGRLIECLLVARSAGRVIRTLAEIYCIAKYIALFVIVVEFHLLFRFPAGMVFVEVGTNF